MGLARFRFQCAIALRLSLRDAENTIAFNRRAYGAEERYRLTDSGGRLVRAELEFGDTLLLVGPLGRAASSDPAADAGPSAIRIRLAIPSADDALCEAVSLGAELLVPAGDEFGLRSGVVRDPFEAEWIVARPLSLKP